MDSFFDKRLITTKDASELSGYTSDYLSRLVRLGKIEGQRIGHSWLIERESLEVFLKNQKTQKSEYAHSLSLAREEEYRAHRSLLRRKAKLSKPPVPLQKGIRESSVFSQVFALTAALLVVASGAFAAQAVALPRLGEQAAELAHQVAFGFSATFGGIPYGIAERIDAADASMRTTNARVTADTALGSARDASPLLSGSDLSLLQNVFPAGVARPTAIALVPSEPAHVPPLTVADVQSSALGAYAFLTSPTRVEDALAGAYAALGTHAYDAITASFAAYRSLIVSSGPGALAFGAFARDMLAKAPHAVSAMNLAFGESVIRATHAAIRADVAVAYGFATAAPTSARVTVALVGGIGNTLAGATARTPALATTAFLQATQVPATLAPALAQTVFSGEYVAATRFVAITNTISERYLALVSGTGTLAYTGTAGVLALANLTPPLFAHAPAAVENTYLGLVGNGALAIDSLPTHLARLVSVKHIPVLAAALPALSAGEQVALFTYQTIHGFFTSATGALASLFGTPNVTVVSNPPSVVLPFATSTTPASTPQPAAPARTERVAVTNYPTYTTVVQGVSQDFVNQSLASLRTSILATVAGMIQPVAAQGVTNENTIQYVNMIQDLSNLTVHNGNFLGGTFNGGNLTNGISVSAASGSFTNLTGGNTSLATTSISGALTTTGNVTLGGTLTAGSLSVSGISSGGAISAPYFSATSSAATSTFSGSLNLGNGGFLYASSTRNVGIGVLSPAALLALQNSTSTQPIFVASNAAGAEVYRITNNGFVGIGTTSPTYALSVEGSSSLGNNAIAGYFSATSSAATSTFAGHLAVGTTSPYGNGLFTVGTTSPLLFVNSTTGRVGVGTSSPGFALDVNGIVNASSLYVNGAPYIGSQWTTASSSIYYNTGNVGIGSTSPYAKLSLAGAAGSTTPLFAISTSTALFATTTALTIDANGNLSLLNGANLSVGGTLAVAGNTTLASATSTAFAITSLPNALLSTNANGSVVASTSIGVNYLSGVLPIANGGTNSSSQTANGIAYYDGSKLTTGSNLSYNGSQLTLDLVDSWGGLHIQGRGGGEASIALNPDNVSNGGAGQWILETNGNGLNNPHDFCWYSSELARCTFNLVSANGYAGFNTNNPIAPLSVNGGFFATASSTIGGGTQTSGLTIAGGATTTLSQYIGGGLTVAGNTTLANATATNLFSATASSTNLFASNAQLGSLSASSLALTNALPVTSGGTGWSAIQSGTIPYGAGTGALATTTAGVAGNILALLNGIPTWTATTTFSSGLAYANGNVTNAGVLSLAQTYGTPQTGALTFATSTQSFNGLTLGTSLTNTLGAFTFTPSVSGTLNNSGLTNSTIALATGTSGTDVNVSGSPAALGGTLTLNIPTASATNRGALSPTDWSTFNAKQAALTFTYPLVNTANTVSTAFGTTTANSFSQLQQFNANASTTQLTSTGSTYLATAGGNVGIGTTSPYSLLSISNSATAAANTPLFTIASTTGGTSTSTLMTVLANGNVGIGTAGPVAPLDVNGYLHVSGNSNPSTPSQGGYFSWNALTGTSGETDFINNQGGGSGGFAFMNTPSSGSPRTTLMVITGTGNVGIGTASPNYNLDFGSTNATINSNGTLTLQGNTSLALQETGDVYGPASLTLENRNGANGAIFSTVGSTVDLVDFGFRSPGAAANIRFEHRSAQILGSGNATNGEFQFLNPTGPTYWTALGQSTAYFTQNVGIGDQAPGTKLSVIGNAAIGYASGQTAPANGLVVNGNVGIGTSTPSQLLTVGNNNQFTVDTSGNATSQGTVWSGASGNGGIKIGSNGLTISQNPSYPYQLVSNSHFTVAAGYAFAVGGPANSLYSGIFYANSSTTIPLVTMGYSGQTADLQQWQNSAGAVLVNVTNSGNLGIGTTSPFATLSVNGNAFIGGNLTVNGLTATTSISAPYFTATNATATSTFAGGFQAAGTSGLTVLQNGNVGIGTTSPISPLTISSSNSSANNGIVFGNTASLYEPRIWTGTGGNYDGYLKFAINPANQNDWDVAVLSGGMNAKAFLSAPSFNSSITGRGDSPIMAWTNTGGNFNGKLTLGQDYITGTSSIDMVIGPSNGTLNVRNNSNTSYLYVNSNNGLVGIGTTNPAQKLDVAGFINTDQYSGYKQAGNTVLYASTTNQALAVGASGAAAWMATSSSLAYSVAVGQGALQTSPTSVTAQYNTAVGVNALSANANGYNNTATGYNALTSNTGGYYNTATGYNALTANTTGNYNTAQGMSALRSNTTGIQNTASGYQALYSNSTNSNNVAYGYQALYSNTADQNMAIGYQALYSNTTGFQNTALGYQALNFNTTGSYNTATGYGALEFTTGNNNTANGFQALVFNSSGNSNSATGHGALYNNTTGSYNTANGQGALHYNTAGNNNLALGYQSGYNVTGSNNTLLGYQSGYDITTGTNNVILGTEQTTGGGITTGSNNILIGTGVRSGLTPTASNQLNIGNLIFATGLGSEATASTGNVGIGTSSPTALLGLQGGIGVNPSQLYLAANGNVGIGTTSPGLPLQVYDTAGNAGIRISSSAANTTPFDIRMGANLGTVANALTFYNPQTSTRLLVLTSTGNLAVGANPNGTDTAIISANGAEPAISISNTTAYNASGVGTLRFWGVYNSTGGQDTFAQIKGGKENTINGNGLGYLSFWTNTALSTQSEKMRITSQGNVGIGTTTPQSLLAVAGGASVGADYNTAAPTNGLIVEGNVGIGLTNPAQKLDVAGNINTSAGSAYMYNGSNVITASTTLNNYFFGGAGNLTMTGNYNIATGLGALVSNSTGSANVATDGFALSSNTTGSSNIATGYGTLNFNTTGSYNIAVGQTALQYNTTGSNNTATGFQALWKNTTGNNNTANGSYALQNNTSATSSTALGYAAAQGTANYSNQGGTYVGFQSGYSAATGSNFNTLLGYQSGYDITTGQNNIVLGTEQTTGGGITTGSNNILIGTGVRSGLSPTASNQLNIGNLIFATGLGSEATASTGNVGIGTTNPTQLFTVGNSLFQVTSVGDVYLNRTAPGAYLQWADTARLAVVSGKSFTFSINAGTSYDAQIGGTTYFNMGNVGIGTTTPAQKLDVAGNINTSAGSAYMYNNANVITASTTLNNYFFGGAGNLTMTGNLNIASGLNALKNNTTGYFNLATGFNALAANTTGYYNVANGLQALFNNTTGFDNIATGYVALDSNTTGSHNIASGMYALLSNTTGSDNITSGEHALWNNTTGSYNTALGGYALPSNITGNNNSALGYGALSSNTAATSSVAVGYLAAAGTANYSNQGGTYVGYQSGYSAATGSNFNTLLGYQSGYDITTGQNNVILGTEQTTGGGITTGSNNILIGTGVRSGLTPTASNQLNIGNLIFATGLGSEATASTGNVGIGTTSPRARLEVGGAANPAIYLSSNYTTPSTNAWSVPAIGTLDLSANAVAGENTLPEWAIHMGVGGGVQSDVFTINRAPTPGGTRSELFRINNSGNVGIGTTSPWRTLSVNGSSDLGTNALAGYFTATSTTATSTFAGFIDVNGTGTNATSTIASNLWVKGALKVGLASLYLTETGIHSTDGTINIVSGTTATSSFPTISTGVLNVSSTTATSTLADGINLSGGCFAVNGTCVGGGSGSGTAGQFPYYAANGTTLTATSSIFLASSGNVGIGTTSPTANLSVQSDGHSSPAATFMNSGTGSNQLSIYPYQDGNTYLQHNGNVVFSPVLSTTPQFVVSSTGNIGIGTTTPSSTLTIQAPAGQTALTIASSTGATMLSVNANGSLTAKLNQLTSDYLVDSGSAPINVGDLVAYVNGKAQKARAAIIAGTPVDANAVSSTQESAAALSSTSFVMAYYNASTGFINAVVGTVSGTTITYGTPVALSASVYSGTNVSVAALSSTAFVISYQAVSTLYAQAVVATVSGTTITYGTPAALNAVSSSYTPAAALSATSFVVAYYNNSTNYANAVVATVSGTTITAGTPQVMSSGTIGVGNFSVAALSSSLFVAAYSVSGSAYLVAGSVSGTTITAGTPLVALSNFASSNVSIATLSSTTFIMGYVTSAQYFNAAVGSISGTTITLGSGYSSPAALGTSPSAPSVAAFSSTSFVATYNLGSSYINAIVGTISGTTVTFGQNVVLNNVASSMYAPPAVAAALSSSTFVVGYRNGSSGYAEAFAAQSVTPSSNIIGMATTAASPGGTVTVASNGIVTGLSGLTTGSTYYDGLALGLSTTTSTYKVGLALSPSSILLNSSNGAGTDQFFGDAVFANNFRITEAPGAPQGLLFENQLGRKVMSIDEAGNLTVSGNLSASGLNLSDVSTLGQELLASAATSTATTTQNAFDFVSGMATVLNSRFNFNAFNALAASTSTPSVFSLYQGTTTPAITISASGNVGIGTTSPNRALTVSGDVGADKFVVPGASSASFTVGTTTLTAEVPSAVLTADGKGVDLYKLSTFTLATVQSLAVQQAALSAQVSSLAARVAKLENGSISVASGSPVSFSSSTLASALSGFGVLIQKGIAQFGTVVANRFVAATDAGGASSAGSGTILAGNTVAQVNNAYAEPTTKVFVTFNAPVTGSWWVSDKAAGSFRVVLSVPQASDVSFDYFLVQTQGQLATSTSDGTFSQAPAQSAGTSSGNTAMSISGPVITLLGANPVHVPVGGTFVEPGVTVTDAVDGTDPYITFINGIQQAVSSTTINTSSPTTYIITYKATDQAGNSATALRSVIVGNPDGTVNLGPAPSSGGSTSGTGTAATPASTATSTASSTTPASTTATSTPSVDTTAPVVTLNGAAAMMLTVGGTFTDPGATATDSVDGNLTSKIKETGAVDTATVGLYTLTYSVTDAAGNTGSASRVVTVAAATSTPSTTAPATSTTTTTTATSTTTSVSSTPTASSTPTTSTASSTPVK